MGLDQLRAWWTYPLAILDFETTGVDPAVCEPVSVAVVRLEDGIEVASYSTLLRPQNPIPPEVTAIHGITDAMVADAPELPDVAGELARVADGAVPCGYNAIHFDRVILHRYVTGSDCPLFDPLQGWVDPLVIVRAVDRYASGSGRHKLARVCARWCVPMAPEDEHTALGDVRAVGRLIVRLIDRGKLRTGTTLGRLTEYTLLKADEQRADFERYLARVKAQAAQTQLALGEGDGDASGQGSGQGSM